MKLKIYIQLLYFIFFLIAVVILNFSKINSPNINLITLISFFLCTTSIIFFIIKKKDYKDNYFLSHLSIIISFYIINFLLIYTDKTDIELYESKGVKWDYRNKFEYIELI